MAATANEKGEKQQEKKQEQQPPGPKGSAVKKLAVIRVRGETGIRKPIRDTLRMLSLYRVNYCTVASNTPSIRGMIQRVKDYVTYGEISDEVLASLRKNRGEKLHALPYKQRTKDAEDAKSEALKSFYRLSPPRKGYGRSGIKKPFSRGGALGYRGARIADLLERMM